MEFFQNFKQIRKNHNIFGKKMRVIFDGNHYVGTEIISKNGNKKFKNNGEMAEFRTAFDSIFTYALSNDFKAMKLSQCSSSADFKEYVKNKLLLKYPDKSDLDELIDLNIRRKIHNAYLRLKRLRNKGYLNKWNYFVTITYDDKKHNEATFRQTLKKCLSNLAYRHGYKYMGVFERSPEEKRLHFHAVMYIPDDNMIGEMKTRRDYSTKQHKIQETTYNTFFEKKFGRTDFEKITNNGHELMKAIDYMTKYIFKTEEQITYSRGLKSELELFVEDEDVASKYCDFVTRYVLFDDCIENNKYIPFRQKKKQLMMFEIEEKPPKRVNRNSNLYRMMQCLSASKTFIQ